MTKQMGRPKIDIDYEALDKMLGIQCTAEECACVFGISSDTLVTRIKEDHHMTFSEYFKLKRGAGKVSLRRKQYEMSKKNPTMAIWLGKQWLNQSDKRDIKHTGDSDNPVVIKDAEGLTNAELLNKINQALTKKED